MQLHEGMLLEEKDEYASDKEIVRAVKDISAGEEITISYR